MTQQIKALEAKSEGPEFNPRTDMGKGENQPQIVLWIYTYTHTQL